MAEFSSEHPYEIMDKTLAGFSAGTCDPRHGLAKVGSRGNKIIKQHGLAKYGSSGNKCDPRHGIPKVGSRGNKLNERHGFAIYGFQRERDYSLTAWTCQDTRCI